MTPISVGPSPNPIRLMTSSVAAAHGAGSIAALVGASLIAFTVPALAGVVDGEGGWSVTVDPAPAAPPEATPAADPDATAADAAATGDAGEDAGEEPPQADEAKAPCPELDEATPMLDKFRYGVERSVCVTAWRFDRLFGVLPEDQIVERRATHGRLRLGLKWDERDGFEEEVALRAQIHLPIAERRMRLVFGRDTDEAFIEGGSREFDGTTWTRID